MSEYKLEIKQVVDYPRCRIYRQLIQCLIKDPNIRSGGSSGLFYYTVLCCYANFRTSYKRIDGISYIVHAGEWICRISELKIPDESPETEEQTENIRVSNYLNSVSKTAIYAVIEKVGKILSLQGFPCYLCPKTEYMLLPLSECTGTNILPVKYTDTGKLRFLLAMNCSGKEIFRFDISMQRSEENAE